MHKLLKRSHLGLSGEQWESAKHWTQIPAKLMGLSVEQASLHKPLSLTWPSGQQIPPISTLPNEHLPQTPSTWIGLAGGQVSVQIPMSLTSPSRQHMPPTLTLFNSHLPQTPAILTGLTGGQVSLQTPLSLTSPSLQQIPPISTSLNWHLLQTFSDRSQCGLSDWQWELSKHWTHTLGFGVVLQIGLPSSVHWALVVHSSIWHRNEI